MMIITTTSVSSVSISVALKGFVVVDSGGGTFWTDSVLLSVLSATYCRGGSRGGVTPPRTAQLIVKFGEKVLQIDYRCCK